MILTIYSDRGIRDREKSLIRYVSKVRYPRGFKDEDRNEEKQIRKYHGVRLAPLNRKNNA